MKNRYEIRGEVTAILLSSKKHGARETLISTNKLEMMKGYPGTWCLSWNKSTGSFYVKGRNANTTIRLHRFITKAPDGMEVDHVDHDTLNNTDENLRVLTVAENQQNRKGAQINNKTSGVRGVSWFKNYNKWMARIRINKRDKTIGYFEDLADAERAIVEYRKKMMPYSTK